MNTSQVGLALNFVGAVLLAACSYFGIGSGYGALVWTSRTLAVLYWVGWALFIAGYAVQYVAAGPAVR